MNKKNEPKVNVKSEQSEIAELQLAFAKLLLSALDRALKRETHELKIEPEYFDSIQQGVKTFEIRFNDRGYTVGDYILFLDKYYYEITYKTNYKQQDGYVVMAIKPVNQKDLKTYYYE